MFFLLYDGSFEGFLTTVFEVYERKISIVKIVCKNSFEPALYGEPIEVIANESKASRVWTGLKKRLSASKCNEVYKTFLSEKSDREDVLLAFIRYIFSSTENVSVDFGNKAVLSVAQISKQVHREKHRMEAFVRFQKTKDELYFAFIEPDFNVLPLIAGHFKDRYADQHWTIYDKKRDYGIQYDKELEKVFEVHLDLHPSADNEFLPAWACAENEEIYQSLWRHYFQSVNIKDRKNKKLHLRHVPIRYWKYLTEKH